VNSAGSDRIELNAPIVGPSGWQRLGPVVTLLLLAPIIAEVLHGATRISSIFALIPEIGAWGCGALIMILFAVGGASQIDWIGKVLINLIATAFIVKFAVSRPQLVRRQASRDRYSKAFESNRKDAQRS